MKYFEISYVFLIAALPFLLPRITLIAALPLILPRITFLDTNTTRTCGFIDFANESGVLNDWINEDRSIEIHVSIQLYS